MPRPVAGPALLMLVLGVACQQRYEDVTTKIVDTDGGEGGAGGGSIPGFGGNSGGHDGGSGPIDMAMSTGGSGGAGGATAMCRPPGSPEICNGKDDDCNGVIDDVTDEKMLNDVLSCGSCNVVCSNPANAVAKCENKKCGYQCVPGAIDIDKGATNGCECLITNGGTEICDGRDNDCNGTVDDGFDLMKDINNCGACSRRCVYPFAKASCVSGACVMGDCLPGFYDRNKDPKDGCEVACGKTNGGVEICDGMDNDCDGVVDNADKIMPTTPCKGMGVCAGTKAVCMGAMGWVCSYPAADYQDNEDTSKGCDGKDNDCDGRTDEAFNVGKACSAGMGACMQMGMIVCDPMDKTKSKCNAVAKAPGVETCNGQDDDCDGKIDELDSSTDRTADDKLVYLPGVNVTMFAHEATRYDATDMGAGNDSSRRPCSVPNRQPWSNISQTEAAAACALIGQKWRLCTRDEWYAACRTPSAYFFPYGSTYAPNKCNGWDYVTDADRMTKNITTVPTGSPTMCTANQGAATDVLYDMSGNVKEWVIVSTTMSSSFELRGGAYNVLSFNGTAPGLQCDAATPAPAGVDVRLPSVGFRCCLEGKLP